MLIERIIFNILAFVFFILMFLKMVKKNDTNYVAILTIQALGITLSFIEIMNGIIQWSNIKLFSYILSIFLPLLIFYLDNRNVNIIEIAYICVAKILQFLKKDKKTKKILNDLINKYPSTYFGHKMLASIYEKEGGMRKAIDEYVKAIEVKRNDYDSYYKISELLNSLSQKDEAITMLNNLLKIKPDYYKASRLLGELLIENNMFKEALNVYKEAMVYRPNDYEIYYYMGIVYTNLNDFKNAKIAYEKASQINHLQYKSKYYLGKISMMYNDVNLAEKYFIEALSGEEVEAWSYYQLARIYMIKSDKEKAIVFLNKAIELDSNFIDEYKKDSIFIPIKVYISNKVNNNIVEKEKSLSTIEKDVLDHLEKTGSVMENLSDLEYKVRKKEKERERNKENTKDNEKER